jgi:uncharacterized protein (TIGR02145 family)
MAENLNTSTYRNGDAIPTNIKNSQWRNTTSGAWAYYNNASYACPYGKLYNGYAVNDSRNLCPVGWHVPSDKEWTVLTSYLGGEDDAGSKMKSSGVQHWRSPNNGASNESGFSGLPAGCRHNAGIDITMGLNGYWWSVAQQGSYDAKNFSLYYYYSNLGCSSNNTQFGFSVRCLKD